MKVHATSYGIIATGPWIEEKGIAPKRVVLRYVGGNLTSNQAFVIHDQLLHLDDESTTFENGDYISKGFTAALLVFMRRLGNNVERISASLSVDKTLEFSNT